MSRLIIHTDTQTDIQTQKYTDVKRVVSALE